LNFFISVSRGRGEKKSKNSPPIVDSYVWNCQAVWKENGRRNKKRGRKRENITEAEKETETEAKAAAQDPKKTKLVSHQRKKKKSR